MSEFREFGAPPSDNGVDGHSRIIHVDADVLADLGHQLRNQLNAMVGAAGLLSTGAETSEERELAAIVESGAEQVARIIDEWLDSATIARSQAVPRDPFTPQALGRGGARPPAPGDPHAERCDHRQPEQPYDQAPARMLAHGALMPSG